MTIYPKYRIYISIFKYSTRLFLIIEPISILCIIFNSNRSFSLYPDFIDGWKLFFDSFIVPIWIFGIYASIASITGVFISIYGKSIDKYEKEKELELSQRPRLIIDELTKHIVESNKELTYSLKCKNDGNSNAKIITYEFTIYKNDISQGPYIVNDYIRNISPNKESVTLSPRIHEKKFSEGFFQTGSIKIHVKINYQNPMNRTYQTDVQFEYDNLRNKYRLLN